MDYNSSNFKLRERVDKFINYLLFLSVTIAFLTLAALVIDILNDGLDWFDFQFFNSFPSRKPEIAGIKAAFYGTIWVMSITALLSIPIGVATALYLEMFADDSKFNRFIKVNISNLAGVPSIIYGIIGMAVFVEFFQMGRVILAGSLTMTLLTLLEDGDHVIFPNPGYPPDEVWAKYAGAKIDHTPLNQEDWQYDLDKLDNMITDKTKLLIINTPQRPNGQIVENPEAIAEIVLKHPDLLVITDEIFSQVIYDGQKHKTISAIPEMKDRCIVIDTWSKTYAMTGWRIGFAVANEEIITKLSI